MWKLYDSDERRILCDECGGEYADYVNAGEGWKSYRCADCMKRRRSETQCSDFSGYPAEVVPSITGDSGEVWIFQGVKVATHTDINAAFAMRDKLNQAGEQWLQAWGFSSRQDRNGNLLAWARCRGCGHEYYPFHERGACQFHFSNEAVCPCDGWAGVGAYT